MRLAKEMVILLDCETITIMFYFTLIFRDSNLRFPDVRNSYTVCISFSIMLVLALLLTFLLTRSILVCTVLIRFIFLQSIFMNCTMEDKMHIELSSKASRCCCRIIKPETVKHIKPGDAYKIRVKN